MSVPTDGYIEVSVGSVNPQSWEWQVEYNFDKHDDIRRPLSHTWVESADGTEITWFLRSDISGRDFYRLSAWIKTQELCPEVITLKDKNVPFGYDPSPSLSNTPHQIVKMSE